MKRRILIIGASGMLGHKLFQKLLPNSDWDIFASVRCDITQSPYCNIPLFSNNIIDGIDVRDQVGVENMLNELKPDWVINCAGIIKQRDSAKNIVSCIEINALFPHKLAEIVAGNGGRLIHFSTDCVFNGKKGNYTENDLSDAEDLYGKTKFLGETVAENSITLRTSIIGRELINHKSLLDWFLSQNGKTVNGYKKAIYSGITTNEMANVVMLIINKYPDLSGLYQVVSEPVSKYDLLQKIKQAFKLDIEIKEDSVFCIDRSMKGDKFRDATGYICPDWDRLVAELASEQGIYKEWGIELA